MKIAGMVQKRGITPALREEIRLSFSMAGGVGLAVWMGGVTAEIYRALRSADRYRIELPNPTGVPESAPPRATTGIGGHDTYAGLLDLTESNIRVDVISGTSAGGLNGALLAFATANQLPSLLPLREVWVEVGDLADLLRPVTVKDPPSLLRGDDYFYVKLVEELKRLADRRIPGTPRYEDPIHLMLTTTLLEGEPGRYPDSFGSTIYDVDHHGLFRFRHSQGGRRGGQLEVTGVDKDVDDATIRRLALASRSSASFPAAFEASYVPVGAGAASAARPDMADVLVFGPYSTPGSRYVIDGGVLANRPLKPTLDAILEMRSRTDVRRVLALVIPDPGQSDELVAAAGDTPPSLVKVLSAAVVGIPANQSLASELQRIEDHNGRLEKRTSFRRALAEMETANINELAQTMYPLYRTLRSQRSARRTMERFAAAVPPGQAPRNIALRTVENALISARQLLFAPMANVVGTESWDWGIKTVERLAGMVLSLADDVYQVLVAADYGGTVQAERLNEVKRDASQLLSLAAVVRQRDDRYWQSAIPLLAIGLRDSRVDLGTWAGDAYGNWLGDPEKRQRSLAALGGAARRAAELIAEIGAVATEAGIVEVEPLPSMFGVFSVSAPVELSAADDPEVRRSDDESVVQPIFERMLALEVLEVVADIESASQPIELIQVSAVTGDAFRNIADPAKKLTSVQLAHFGAFYKRYWRANDFMWGRLDGAARTVQVLLNADRVRNVWSVPDASPEAVNTGAGALVAALRDRAVGGPCEAWLDVRWEQEEIAILAEATMLLQARTPPARLVNAERALLRRLQLEILREELPEIVVAIRADDKDGAFIPALAHVFLDKARVAEAASWAADETIAAFEACRIGEERITDELGSDYLTELGSRAAGVGLAAAQSRKNKLGLVRRPFQVLRGAFITLYYLARSATRAGRNSRTTMAVILALFAAAGIIIASSLISGDPQFAVSVIGLVVLATVLLWVGVHSFVTDRNGAGRWTAKYLLVLAGTIVLALAPFHADTIYGWFSDSSPPQFVGETRDQASLIAGLIILFGLMYVGASTVGGRLKEGDPLWRRWILSMVGVVAIAVIMFSISGPIRSSASYTSIGDLELAGSDGVRDVLIDWSEAAEDAAAASIWWDFAWIIFYVAAFLLTFMWVLRIARRNDWGWLSVLAGIGIALALMAGLLDVAENVGMLELLDAEPIGAMAEATADRVRSVALSKFALAGVALVIVVVGALARFAEE